MLQPSTPELFYYPHTIPLSIPRATFTLKLKQVPTPSLSTRYIQVRKDAGAWRIERHPCCRPRSFRRLRTGHPAEQPPRGAGYGIRCQSALRRQQDAFSPTPFVAAVNLSGSPLSVQRAHPQTTRDTWPDPAPGDMARVAASAPRPLRPGAAGPRPPPLPRGRARASRHTTTALLCVRTHITRDYRLLPRVQTGTQTR